VVRVCLNHTAYRLWLREQVARLPADADSGKLCRLQGADEEEAELGKYERGQVDAHQGHRHQARIEIRRDCACCLVAPHLFHPQPKDGLARFQRPGLVGADAQALPDEKPDPVTILKRSLEPVGPRSDLRVHR
jgi:hypothetical protein